MTARSRDAAESAINFYLNEMEAAKVTSFDGSPRLKPRALVVDGKTLTFILDLRYAFILNLFLKNNYIYCFA